jgi:hypothetical protein
MTHYRISPKIDGRWRQVDHRGSFDDPALLAQYQAAIGKSKGAVALEPFHDRGVIGGWAGVKRLGKSKGANV